MATKKFSRKIEIAVDGKVVESKVYEAEREIDEAATDEENAAADVEAAGKLEDMANRDAARMRSGQLQKVVVYEYGSARHKKALGLKQTTTPMPKAPAKKN